MPPLRARTIATRAALTLAGAAAIVAGPACSMRPPAPDDPALTSAQRMDPAACSSCHASHYAEWSGSMHAHASDDPLFVAMNKRALRETGGAIGTFCLQCHAPMALATPTASASIDVTRLPPAERGVTCYFCHSVDAVSGTSNDPLHLASDGVFRAAIANPVSTPAHASTYSALHDRTVTASASLCGACHDVQLASGLPIEQTFAEWQASAYAQSGSLVTCGKCHLTGTQGLAAAPPSGPPPPLRTVHDHAMPGVDLPSGQSPGVGSQAALVQELLDPALRARLCVAPSAQGVGATATVTLTNSVVGHDFPSGAVHDRRAWVELVASAKGQVVFQSGVVPNDQTSVEALDDPNLWLFKESLLDSSASPVLFMWEAKSTQNVSLPVAVTEDPADPRFDQSVSRAYPLPALPDDVKLRVRLAPVALEVVGSLVASGDLASSDAAKLAVYTLAGTAVEWAGGPAGGCVP